ncbi:3-phosphoglycerate dehydrogenase [Candidatus Marinamargulisbacteria bacterium SCGC AG-439-L15]|nr:3-phosphoglycerate dehydrogenase [Candidatus Marinamargulisbacteria bacterium SCGC AG-439-L15]
MYKVKTFNKIATKGLDRFERDSFEVASEIAHPDAIVVRSHKLHDMEFIDSLKAIGRAGAGVNNIPLDSCTEKGVVVFNAPGANANAVKELVFTGMFLAARDIVGGVDFVKTLKGSSDVGPVVEKNKSRFAGVEIQGKKLGVIGLGAIGLMVANTAIALGMEVEGHDPFLSVNRAWELSSSVKPAPSLERMLKTSDFISIHVPYTEETKTFFNQDKFEHIKEGSVLLNFSREGLVDPTALKASFSDNKLAKYVTDFPTDELVSHENVLSIPHLGASTKEAEENCAVMIADQVKDFLFHGNITNSVNFPNGTLDYSGLDRVTVTNQNVPNVIGQVTSILASFNINIIEMMNKSRGDLAYSIVDLDGALSDEVISQLNAIEGVIRTRYIPKPA